MAFRWSRNWDFNLNTGPYCNSERIQILCLILLHIDWGLTMMVVVFNIQEVSYGNS